MSRIGVIGPVAPDYFAENVGDALQRLGHVVTQLGPAHSRGRSQLFNRAAGLARQALPRLDERAQDRIVRAALGADCEIIINVDSYLMPSVVTRLRSSGARVAFWFPDHCGEPRAAAHAASSLRRDLLQRAVPYGPPAGHAGPAGLLPAGGLQSPLAPAGHRRQAPSPAW